MRQRWGERIARWLVRRQPRAFRSRYGDEIDEALTRAGQAGASGAWLVWDAARTLVRLWSDAMKHGHRGGRRASRVRDLTSEVRIVVRSLVREPLHAIIAVAILAVAIGANAAVFEVAYSILIRTLPYGEPERIVRVTPAPNAYGSGGGWDVSPLLTEVPQVEVSSAYTADGRADLVLRGSAMSVRVTQVGREFFDVLGVVPVSGAGFSESGADHEAILSWGLWQRVFGNDMSVIGRTVQLSGHVVEVVGVAPPEVGYPAGTEVWMTYPMIGSFFGGATSADVIARLTAAEQIREAQANHERLKRAALLSRGEQLSESERPRLEPLRAVLVGSARDALPLLFGAATLVLLLGCVNVAGISVARQAAREGDTAVRRALGASRSRLVRSVLTESLLIAVVAGGLSLLFAYSGRTMLLRVLPTELSFLSGEVSWPALLGFVLLASLASGLAVSAIPAVRVAFGQRTAAIAAGRLSVRKRGVHPLLVVAEIALAVVLVVAAGLLGRSLAQLRSVPLGYELDRVLTFEVRMPVTTYTADEVRRFLVFAEDVRGRLALQERVESVGYASRLPLGEGLLWAPRVWSADRDEQDGHVNAPLIHVSDGFFGALGVPILAGRDFRPSRGSEGSVVVSRSLALELFGTEQAVGKRLRIRQAFNTEPETRTVTGVVGDVRQRGYEDDPGSAFYVPFAERPQAQIAFALRGAGVMSELVATVRRVVAEVNNAVAPTRIATTRVTANEAVATREALALLSAVFGSAALVLAVLGVYGLIAQSVIRRRREMGVRLAVGARALDLLALVLRSALGLTLVGVALGLLVSLAATRLLSSFLFGVGATDPATFAAVAAVALIAATMASLIPARRAARTDPIASLRNG